MIENPTKALRRGEVYGFLALAFRYPDAALFGLLKRENDALGASREALGEAACARAVRALRRSLQRLTPRAMERAYQSCFGHTISKECPPYEAEYGQAHVFQKAHTLADIAGFYRAFGLETARGLHERVDHVSVELEFMHFLCLKEAYAEEQGHAAERIALCGQAQAKFLSEHLARWAIAFSRRLQARSGGGFYGCLGELLEAFLVAELAARGIEATRVARPDGLALVEEAPDPCLSCGAASDASP